MTDEPMTDERLFDAEYMLQATGWRDSKIRQLQGTIRLDRVVMQKAKEVIKAIYRDSFNRASLNLEHENLLLEAELLLGDRLEASDD